MLTVKRQHAKPPAGGHRFTDGPVTLKGEVVDDVLSKMEAHRAENALPLDFPEEDLGRYYQIIAPYLVREVDGNRIKGRSQIEAEAIMSLWRAHPKALVDASAIVELRLKQCEECPLRREFKRDEESSRLYMTTARRRAALLCSDREFATRGRCSWCELPVDLIGRLVAPGKLPGLPPVPKICWVHEL
jgi:hypothetical protein